MRDVPFAYINSYLEQTAWRKTHSGNAAQALQVERGELTEAEESQHDQSSSRKKKKKKKAQCRSATSLK